jgi:hypothetical protein
VDGVTPSARFLRAALPCVTALAAVLAFSLPASAQSAPSRGSEWWLSAINVPKAWQIAPGQGAGVTVAVLSTGVDATHPDLTGDVSTGPDFSDSGRAPGNQFWGTEGTAVASLIAGHGHGSGGESGITGIAPRAKILSVPVTLEYNDPRNSDTAITAKLPGAIANGIRYAVAHGAQVIALPLDPGTFSLAATGNRATNGKSAAGGAAEQQAVSYALSRGVVLIAPAGDNGASTNDTNYPAAYPGVVAVGATQKSGGLASFTNTRPYVALAAPGDKLPVAAPGGGYGTLSSSDMSSALTAGVAALIRSRFPHLSVAQTTRALETGTTPVSDPSLPGDGHGEINAANALRAAAAINAALPPSAPAKPGTSANGPSKQSAGSAAAQDDASTLVGSVLRDVVIVAGTLIVVLAAGLVLLRNRRRETLAARHATAPAHANAPGHGTGGHGTSGHGTGGSHTRRAIEAAGKAMAGRADSIVLRGAAFNPGASRAASRARSAAYPAARPRIIPMTALASGRQARRSAGRPPWELPAGSGPAPLPANLSDRISNSGPMYVWNPATSSGPFPAAPDPSAQPGPNAEQRPEPPRRRPPL